MALALRRFRVPAFLVLAVGVLAWSESAAAAPDCRQQVIEDWSDDGRVDRVYPLACYQEAIEAMAPDIRDYSDAQETIERALTLAVRKKGGAKSPTASRSLAAARPLDTSGSAPVPLPLVALGALGASALAAGTLAYVSRRAALGRKGGAR
jgi:hypothetical protein